MLIEECDSNKTVRMQNFFKVKATTKKCKEVTKLTATATNGNIQFIHNFINQLL